MARQKSKKWSDYMWLVSATYFTLGFFNIVFAWLGVICFMIPLLMAVFGGGKGYCNNYCGRGPDDYPHCDGGKGCGESPSDHSPALDL